MAKADEQADVEYFPAPRRPPHYKQRASQSTFEQDVFDQWLIHVQSGMNILQIHEIPGMPHYNTVMTWVDASSQRQEAYARAREKSADMLEAHIHAMAMGVLEKPMLAQAVRESSSNLKWMAAKRNPKVYGDRVDVAVTHDVTDRLEAVRKRRETLEGDGG